MTCGGNSGGTDSCDAALTKPTRLQERHDLIDHLDKRPDAMWRTGTLWSFRNEAKVYGSPMLDAVWSELSHAADCLNPLPGVVVELRSAQVPARYHASPRPA